MNIYDSAHELARLLRESDEFKTYKQIKDEIFADEGSKKLIETYKQLEFEAQTTMMSGKEPQQELLDKLKKISAVMQLNPRITEYIIAEYKISTIIADIYKILGDACETGADLFK